jgi:hypothetical protein
MPAIRKIVIPQKSSVCERTARKAAGPNRAKVVKASVRMAVRGLEVRIPYRTAAVEDANPKAVRIASNCAICIEEVIVCS